MSKQTSNREKRNRIIVDAAEKLLTRNNWDSVQMQNIADEAGIGVATLFRYFPQKQLVVVAVAVRILSRELDFFEKIYREPLSGIKKIEAVFQHLNRLDRPSSINEAKFIDVFDANIGEIENYEVAAAEYFELRNSVSGIVGDIVREGQKDASLPKGEAVTAEIMTMINNYGLFARKLALMKSILELETNPAAREQLDIMYKIYMERLNSSHNQI